MIKGDEKSARWVSWGVALGVTALFFVIARIGGAPVYQINDDLQLQGILSGAYAGVPDYHTVYMRSPLSYVLMLLYRMTDAVPWLGLFYEGCLGLCVCLLLRRELSVLWKRGAAPGSASGLRVRWLVAAEGLLAVMGLAALYLAPQMVMPHYTLIASALGATGLYLLMTDAECSYRSLSAAFVLLLLCEQLRPQVFFLLCPFLALALVYRVMGPASRRRGGGKADAPGETEAGEIHISKGGEARRLVVTAMAAAFLWLLLYALHMLAYRGEAWQQYLTLNDARTQLYDYTLVWESDEARTYYAALGVDEAAYPLYRHYDILPDAEADAARLYAMADYVEPSRAVDMAQHVKNVLYDLRVRILHRDGQDAPYGWVVIALYVLAVIAALRYREYRVLGSVVLCGALHLGLYGYLLWRGRAPERVTLSLYLIVSFFLAGCLRRGLAGLSRALAGLLCLAAFLSHLSTGAETYREQITVNQTDNVLYSYMNAYPERLYLLETSTAVYRTAPVLRTEMSSNVLLLGGWQYGSPLQDRLLSRYGYVDASELFLGRGTRQMSDGAGDEGPGDGLADVYYVCRVGRGLDARDLQDFLDDRYAVAAAQMTLMEELHAASGDEEAVFYVYRLE